MIIENGKLVKLVSDLNEMPPIFGIISDNSDRSFTIKTIHDESTKHFFYKRALIHSNDSCSMQFKGTFLYPTYTVVISDSTVEEFKKNLTFFEKLFYKRALKKAGYVFKESYIVLDENGEPETDDMLIAAMNDAMNSKEGVMYTRNDDGSFQKV